MRVYHFLNYTYGLEALSKRRLKIAIIHELNDPFEFLGCDLSTDNLRKAMEGMKKQMSEHRGLLCFSGSWQSPVLWAHYAECHKGLCLGFDVPDFLLKQVVYVDRRISLNDPVTEGDMMKIISTKFAHWSYEDEYRGFVSLEEEENGLYFHKFSNDLRLREVAIGCKSATTIQVVYCLLSDLNNVDVYNTRPAFNTFKIERT
jgi:hypothetical protein